MNAHNLNVGIQVGPHNLKTLVIGVGTYNLYTGDFGVGPHNIKTVVIWVGPYKI